MTGPEAAGAADTPPVEHPAAPLLRVVHGTPTAEELAALVAVIAASSTGTEDSEPGTESQWAAPARLHRSVGAPGGPGSWWASGLPR